VSRHVRITHLDGKLPNLALMRLSAFHKAIGDSVTFTKSPTRQLWEPPSYDAVYASAIFTMSQKTIERMRLEFPEAVIGGTGAKQNQRIEDILGFFDAGVDYSLYPKFTASIGFTQRGCRLSCKFCVVPMKEGKPVSASSVYDIWRGDGHPKHLHLLDNDFFGGPDWRDVAGEIASGGFKVSFTQGINIRMITEEVAATLAEIPYRDDSFSRSRLYTAWDNLKDEGRFFAGVDILAKAGIPPQNLMVYMLCGFKKGETIDEVMYRFRRMADLGIRPYPMVYDPTNRELKRFQRWAVTGIWRKVAWQDYSTRRNPEPKGMPLFDEATP